MSNAVGYTLSTAHTVPQPQPEPLGPSGVGPSGVAPKTMLRHKTQIESLVRKGVNYLEEMNNNIIALVNAFNAANPPQEGGRRRGRQTKGKRKGRGRTRR